MKSWILCFTCLLLVSHVFAAPTSKKEKEIADGRNPDEAILKDDKKNVETDVGKSETLKNEELENKDDDKKGQTSEVDPVIEEEEDEEEEEESEDVVDDIKVVDEKSRRQKRPRRINGNRIWTPYGMMAGNNGNVVPQTPNYRRQNGFPFMVKQVFIPGPMEEGKRQDDSTENGVIITGDKERKEGVGHINTGAEGEERTETQRDGGKMVKIVQIPKREKTRATWTTMKPNNETIKENVVLSHGSNVMMARSRGSEYRAVTIIDFKSKTHAIKVSTKEDEEEKEEEKPKSSFFSKLLRLKRKYIQRRKEFCFTKEAEVSIDDVYNEIEKREKNETVMYGTSKEFYVEKNKTIPQEKIDEMGFMIKTLCKGAAKAGRVYELLSESEVEMDPEPLEVIGQFDKEQEGVSVPYLINLDSSIDFHK